MCGGSSTHPPAPEGRSAMTNGQFFLAPLAVRERPEDAKAGRRTDPLQDGARRSGTWDVVVHPTLDGRAVPAPARLSGDHEIWTLLALEAGILATVCRPDDAIVDAG